MTGLKAPALRVKIGDFSDEGLARLCRAGLDESQGIEQP
jgi:hypothetical protein